METDMRRSIQIVDGFRPIFVVTVRKGLPSKTSPISLSQLPYPYRGAVSKCVNPNSQADSRSFNLTLRNGMRIRLPVPNINFDTFN